MKFKEQWTTDTALKILAHDSVDAKLWAEAVKWLLLYGPDEIRQLLLDASLLATSDTFPQLQPVTVSPSDQLFYNLTELAKTLSLSEEELKEKFLSPDDDEELQNPIDGSDTIH